MPKKAKPKSKARAKKPKSLIKSRLNLNKSTLAVVTIALIAFGYIIVKTQAAKGDPVASKARSAALAQPKIRALKATADYMPSGWASQGEDGQSADVSGRVMDSWSKRFSKSNATVEINVSSMAGGGDIADLYNTMIGTDGVSQRTIQGHRAIEVSRSDSHYVTWSPKPDYAITVTVLSPSAQASLPQNELVKIANSVSLP